METARRMMPGYIFDMYKMRVDYDMRILYGKRAEKALGLYEKRSPWRGSARRGPKTEPETGPTGRDAVQDPHGNGITEGERHGREKQRNQT